MGYNYIFLIIGYLAAIVAGALIMYFIQNRTPEGTIIIEERSDETDLFKFELPIELDEIKAKKKILFNIIVQKEQYPQK